MTGLPIPTKSDAKRIAKKTYTKSNFSFSSADSQYALNMELTATETADIKNAGCISASLYVNSVASDYPNENLRYSAIGSFNPDNVTTPIFSIKPPVDIDGSVKTAILHTNTSTNKVWVQIKISEDYYNNYMATRSFVLIINKIF